MLSLLAAAGEPAAEVDTHVTLLAQAQAPPSSQLGRLSRVLQRAESASHTLVWARGVTLPQGRGRRLVIERVELPRLRQTFTLRFDGGRALLESAEQSGFVLSDSRPGHLPALARGLPLCLVLEHADDPGSLLLLAPSVALRRPPVLTLPFSADVVPVRRGDWCHAMRSRVLTYPVHASGAMLVYRSATAALYHVMCLLYVREYAAAAALLPAAALDGPPTEEQQWLLRQLFMSSDDRTPNACAVRLRLMAQLLRSSEPLASGGTLAGQGLLRAALNNTALSPLGLLGWGNGDPWGVAWAQFREWVGPGRTLRAAPEPATVEGLPAPPAHLLCPAAAYGAYLLRLAHVAPACRLTRDEELVLQVCGTMGGEREGGEQEA